MEEFFRNSPLRMRTREDMKEREKFIEAKGKVKDILRYSKKV